MLWFDHRELRLRANDEWYVWGRDRVSEVRDLECSPERVIGTVESFVARLTCRDDPFRGGADAYVSSSSPRRTASETAAARLSAPSFR